MRAVALPVRFGEPFAKFAPFLFLIIFTILFVAAPASATSVIPTTDRALYDRADVVVHGVVVSSQVQESLDGSPETVTVIEPLEVLKGGIPGKLILRQAGGTLPNGKFFRLWGRPEYVPGREVIVFAISRPDGDYQTAEMLLGKFEVWNDDKLRPYAVSELAKGNHEGVHVIEKQVRSVRRRSLELNSLDGPRNLEKFLTFLRRGAQPMEVAGDVAGLSLAPVVHPVERELNPSWAPISGLWRYSNGANAGWTLDGTANISGGGTAEAQRALATWTNEPNSTINHYVGGSNPIHLNALSSPCGWSTALPTSLGVVGCGGPRGGGSSHVWRGETYGTITGGEVWLRAYSVFNQLSSVVTESIILHELGHALGLGHSDQAASPNDTCRGDESAAIMRSSVQSRTTLGSDDVDAVRWLYGDGGKSCSPPPPPPSSGVQGDFNGDGKADLLWRNYTTGENYVWFMNGTATIGGASLLPIADVRWRIEGTADFNNDGKTDILWRHTTTGENYIWLMNGTTMSGGASLNRLSNLGWRVGGIGDLNADGKPDIVWRHSTTGENYVWIMNGVSQAGGASLPVVGSAWEMAGIGDLNGDGKRDIIWRHTSTGDNYVWWMNGTTMTGGATLNRVSDSRWKIQSLLDLNADGRTDIVWRHTTTGENYAWYMNGGVATSGQNLIPVSASWGIGGPR